MKRLTLTILVVSQLVGWGCSGSSSPTAPDTSLSGTYVGTMQDSSFGGGNVGITITQSGPAISGTWQATFPDPSNNNSGSLTGTVNGNAVAFTLNPSTPGTCPLNVTATNSANRITGDYAAVNCSVAHSGRIHVTNAPDPDQPDPGPDTLLDVRPLGQGIWLS